LRITNFGELRACEVRGILLPRTPVNNCDEIRSVTFVRGIVAAGMSVLSCQRGTLRRTSDYRRNADPNASALEWAGRARENGRPLPFPVVGLKDDPGRRRHAIVDSPGRLRGEELEEAAYESDLLVVPTTPDALAISALAAFLEDMEGFEGHAEHRVLLTMVPWWNFSGAWAQRDLMEAGIPLFEGQVRLREAVRTAALDGVPVYELAGRGAKQVWEDYRGIGEEVLGRR
jgi:chromosome partitioning protein